MPDFSRDSDFLEDIREEITHILDYTQGYNFHQFMSDRKIQDAVIRNIEIIGEPAKLISPETRNAHPEIAWKEINGTRDRLIHHYFGINLEIVWNIIQNDLGNLNHQIWNILNKR
jgi:uncharacterized protein with HEPN domain